MRQQERRRGRYGGGGVKEVGRGLLIKYVKGGN